jgi:predicted DsbA family dithiol-disulfide isomerase
VLREEWLPFEIHPETPPGGVLLAERLPHIDWEELYRQLRQSGASYGIAFGNVTLLSNSRLALEAGEFARARGRYEEFHEAVFHAYFTKTEDIGSMAVLMEIARTAGLDAAELKAALGDGRYRAQLDRVTREARQCGITGAPTFVLNGRYRIVGAQPLDVFKETLSMIQSGHAAP